MAPAALSTTYTTLSDIQAYLSSEGVELRLDDNGDGAVSATESNRATQGINYATAKINDYCLGRYEVEDLAANWTVNSWATVLAARFICLRRGNPVPKSIKDLYDEVMEDLAALKRKDYDLGDVAERVSSAPAWSNVRVRVVDRLRRIRVERPISEGTPRRIAPNADRQADIIGPEY